MRRSLASVVVVVGLAAGSPARAQDPLPIDVELIRPGLSPRGGFAVDAPQAVAARTWSVGALLQYENAPLRLYDGGDRLGDLVEHRAVVQVHAGISASRRTSFSVVLPVAVHFGADEDVVRARNGAGIGDASVTARFLAGTWKQFSLGVLGTVLLPTGNRQQYMGERLPRLRAGLLGFTDLGRVSLLTNLLVHVREPVDTPYDFTAASELQVDLGVQGAVVPGRLDVIGELVSRVGLATDPGGGRLASELLAGVRYTPGDGAARGLRIDLALGKGLTAGYGTTGVRALLGISYVRSPRPRPVVATEPPPPPLLPDVLQEVALPEAITPPTPPPAPPAQLEGARIVFRDPIAFEKGTTHIVPASQPVLDAVAEVILGPAADLHVVVEGHASDEGGYAFNYELSRERARAIVEALILRGVHPKRLSWRGAGEVEPVGQGDADGEAAREQNRRVVFRVMRPLDDEARPTETEVRLPWSGEPHRVVPSPAEPAATPAEPAPPASEAVEVGDTLPAAPDDEITLPSDLPEPTP